MRGLLKRLWSDRKAAFGLSVIGLFVFIAVVGPWFVADPLDYVGVPLSPPSWEHWLGTTGQGQDMFAQVVVGARTSLAIGFVVGISVVAIGALVGTAAGYFGGFIDDALSLLINVFLVMPALPLMVVIAAYFPAGATTIAIILIVTGWAWGARVIRAQALSLRGRDFVSAAIVGGESHVRIIVFEILPNMSSLLASSFIGATVYAIGAQVGLEFLGLGDSSQVTWGTNLYWSRMDLALVLGSWWTFVPTGLCVALVGFALGLLNAAIDEIGNPRLRREPAFEKALAKAGISYDGGATPVLRSEHGAR